MNRATFILIVFMAAAVAALGFTAGRWHTRYAKAENARREAVQLADTRLQAINDIMKRQQQNAALDARYTKELADAKAEAEKLRDDLDSGRRRLHIHATCLPAAKDDTATTGKADAATARLTPDAEQDYQRLRTEIRAVTAQVSGLQQYITEQCN
ncbi:lysis protein [Salmonella enterica]